MSVVFLDKARETYYRVEGVEQLQSCMMMRNGRLTNMWVLTMPDGCSQTFKQKDFPIHRIEGGLIR